MSTLNDPAIQALLEQPNVAIVSTLNADGSIHSTIVWVNTEGDELAVNSAVGRSGRRTSSATRTSRSLVYPPDNPMDYVEIRGTATVDRRRRRAHQRAQQEVHQSGQVPVPRARRGADQVHDRPGARPLPEAGLVGTRGGFSDGGECGARRVTARGPNAARPRRGRRRDRTAARRCAPGRSTSPARPRSARSCRGRRWPAQITVQTANAIAPPPASWNSRRWRSLRRLTKLGLLLLRAGRQLRQVLDQPRPGRTRSGPRRRR